jgi:hypothetical protein
MAVDLKRLAIRAGGMVLASALFALAAAFLRALKDPLWERHILGNFVLYAGSVLAGLPWFYLVDDSQERSWRGWIPAPLALLTGGSAFCLIFDLQRGRHWSDTITQLPEAMYWFAGLPAAVSAMLLLWEHTRPKQIGLSGKDDDVA